MLRNSFHFSRRPICNAFIRLAVLLCAASATAYLTACGGGTTGTTQTVGSDYTVNVVYNFAPFPDGNGPAAGVVLDVKGNLYGTTVHGGTFSEGTAFEITPNGGQWTEKVLYNFCHPGMHCSDGSEPISKLTFDSAGNLYGTASQGGLYSEPNSGIGNGVVFELTPQQDGTWTETVLYNFQGGWDGDYPQGGSLLFDKDGSLYGTTLGGGGTGEFGFGNGTIFELSPASSGQWTEQVLAVFCFLAGFCGEGEGANPQDGLVFDSSGNLFGVTRIGPPKFGEGLPAYGYGTVFELGPTSSDYWSQSWPYNFQSGPADGATPMGGLAIDSSGAFYGTTSAGGNSTLSPDSGTVFKLALGTDGKWHESVLYNFCALPVCADGSHPTTGVVFDQSGNLYGTTMNGGTLDAGVVFKLEPQPDGTWKESTLYTFQGADTGQGPVGLTIGSSGNLFVVAAGGSTGRGIILELTPQTAD
ncbi:MAG TPA: choice-of-anchor tandem repeat GloVer-containing protein [Candidatus Eisenbacteria bacterium]|nr:choice-of-anchor tandem repeat GloVer-containing protein [Candidatus Eisenbacteria bacterium]